MTYTNNDTTEKEKKPNNSNSIKKWSGIIGLVLLTIGLMIVFKKNSDIENKIVNFYAKNLQPLFVKTEITNEDIFNFALYRNLPIDKHNNKVLEIINSDGNEVSFKVTKTQINNTTNYNKFVSHFQLNNTQQGSLDSILNSYKSNVYSSILINDKNVVAIDPKILVLRESLVYDIAKYLENNKITQPGEFLNIYSTKSFSDDAIKIFDEVKNINSKNNTINGSYMCFTPDSVYKIQCKFNPEKIKNQISVAKNNNLHNGNYKVNVFVNADDLNKSGFVDFSELKDSIIYKTGKNDGIVAKIVMPMLNSIYSYAAAIDEQKIPKLNKHSKNQIEKLENLPYVPEIQFETNLQDVDSIIDASISSIVTEDNIKSWVQFGLKMDSLSTSFSYTTDTDSLERLKEVTKELKELKKEMEKLKKNKSKQKSSDD